LDFIRSAKLGLAIFVVATASMFGLIYVPVANKLLLLASGVRFDLYMWGIIFSCLILSIYLFPNRLIVNPLSAFLGRISFGVYLLHPVVIFC